MAFSENDLDLKNIMQLAYLNEEAENNVQLAEEVSSIMHFVDQLRKIDTTNITPLFHPLDLPQRFRIDEINEADCSAQLAETAPLFEDGLFLVLKVIDLGQ